MARNNKENSTEIQAEVPNTVPGLQFIGVNTMEVAPGASDSGADLAVLDLGINMEETFIPYDIESTLEQSIAQLLDAFATNRGYATSLTAVQVRQYIEAAIKYYSLIVASWRAENASNLRTASGVVVASLFRNRILQMTPKEIFTGAAIKTRADNNGGTSISNAVWLRDHVVYLQDVFLPSNVLRFVFGLFSGVYSLDNYTDAGNNSLLMVHPGLLNEADSVQVRAKAAGVLLNTLSSTPDMISFLKFMGWSNEEAISTDLTRDLHGNTLVIYDDPAFIDQLINGKVIYSFDLGVEYGAPGLDTDVRDIYYDPTDEYGTPFTYRDRKAFMADDFMLTAMFHRGLVPNPTLSIYQLAGAFKALKDGTVSISSLDNVVMTPQHFVYGAVVSKLNEGVLNRISQATNNWLLYFNIPVIGIPDLQLGYDENGYVSGYSPITVTKRVSEGPNAYYINNDDMVTYRTIAWLRFLLGEDYRRWLQLSISRSITSRLGEK